MSKGLNKVMIIGNLGKDPELKYTTNTNKAVVTFSVAVSNPGPKKEDGTREENTEWFRVTAWEKLAETMNEYLRKGSKVYIEGRLQTRKYTDKDGVERSITELVASEMNLLDSKGDTAVTGTNTSNSRQRVGAAVTADTESDDIPF